MGFQYTLGYIEVKYRIQVMFDATLLEGAPTMLTRVSNHVKKLVFPTCILLLPHIYLLNYRSLCF
jgi:hypothetical protein